MTRVQQNRHTTSRPQSFDSPGPYSGFLVYIRPRTKTYRTLDLYPKYKNFQTLFRFTVTVTVSNLINYHKLSFSTD